MNSMYSVEQVNVPPELGTILKQYTKAVIRDKPTDIYRYSANFFAVLSGTEAPFGEDSFGQKEKTADYNQTVPSYNSNVVDRNNDTPDNNDPVEISEQEAVNTIMSGYDSGDGKMNISLLPNLLAELKETLGLGEQDLPTPEELLEALAVEGDTIQLLELQQTLFETG